MFETWPIRTQDYQMLVNFLRKPKLGFDSENTQKHFQLIQAFSQPNDLELLLRLTSEDKLLGNFQMPIYESQIFYKMLKKIPG